MARLPRAEWERRFLVGLQEEWELARWRLPMVHARTLRPPVFGISASLTEWGKWHAAPRRELQLSWRLVWDHPWYAAVEVLWHEMAHQVAEECLGVVEETAHGPAFRQACQWLQVRPRATGTYPTLDQLLAGNGELSEDDRIMARIRKLLALAESPNRHEAELALAKAQELMGRHNVELHEHAARRDFVSVRLGQAKKRHTRDDQYLAGLLTQHYMVQGIWIPGYDPESDTVGTVFEISGTALNVRLAHYVFDYVREFCRREWLLFAGRRRLGLNARRDFTLGILSGFAETLRQGEANAPDSVRALVQRGDPELNRYFAERYPRQRTRRRSAARCQADLLDRGREVGRELTIHPGIEAPSGPKLLNQ